MEKYELLYILPAKHTEKELDVLANGIKDIVIKHGGEVKEEHNMGKRKLAYPIDHVRYGHYYLVIFEAETSAVDKLNSTLRLTTELLRHLIIKRDPYIKGVPKLAEEYSIVRKDKERDRDRGPRRRVATEGRPNRTDESGQNSDAENTGNGGAETERPAEIEDLDQKIDKILTDEIL